MSELQVEVKQQEGVIDFSNFDEIKTQLADKMNEYKEFSFSEDTKTLAKGELAGLRKLRTSVDSRRKEVKNAFMKPYTDFEEKTKELIQLIDEPITLIDEKIKVFELNQKEEKREKIVEYFNDAVGDMADILPIEKIYDRSWENVSMSMNSIKEVITKAVDSTRLAVSTIKDMKSEAEAEALEIFKQNLSITDAITYINNYEAQKQQIIERQKQEEAAKIEQIKQAEIARIREEERQKVLEEQKQQQEVEQKVQEAKEQALDAFIPDQTSDTSLYEYRIELSKESKNTLEMYMNSVGIEWEVI